MIKIIKYGFLPINNDRQRGQNISKGQKLFESGHVFDVIETVGQEQETILTGKIVAQTKISNVYDVKITLDCNRNIKSATCNCKAGLSGQCKHVCALVYYVNFAESAESKTSYAQQWGKPTYRQLLGYDKGVTMAELFPTPPISIKVLRVFYNCIYPFNSFIPKPWHVSTISREIVKFYTLGVVFGCITASSNTTIHFDNLN